MEIAGRVHQGVVVLEGGATLPEGAPVTVSYPGTIDTKPVVAKKWRDLRGRVQHPLFGEDAQAWVSRTRRDDDEQRAAVLETKR